MTIILDGTKGTTSPGLYSNSSFTDTYTDGVVVDYTTGTGRITVGSSDGFAIRNGGPSSPVNLLSQANSGYSLALQGATSGVGTGISFPATQVASSDANTLDDYEEGTWTPAFTGAGGNPTYTLGNTAARYIKIGRLIFFNLSIQFSGKSGGSGTLGITLPFPVSSVTNMWCGSTSVGYCDGLAFPVSGTYTDPGQSSMFFRRSDLTATLLTTANLSAAGHIMMGGCYYVDN